MLMHLTGCLLMHNQWKWDHRYLELAKFISNWSKDPSTKCGAVITDQHNRIISLGFNGFPVSVKDTKQRLNNRDLKYAITIHAERNAILFAKQDLHNCTLYTWPFQACSECAAMMIQAGITRHVAPTYSPTRWKKSFKLANQLFDEANITVNLHTEEI